MMGISTTASVSKTGTFSLGHSTPYATKGSRLCGEDRVSEQLIVRLSLLWPWDLFSSGQVLMVCCHAVGGYQIIHG